MLLRVFTAVLALLIGGALLWVITAGSNSPRPEQRTTSPQEKKAVRIEKRLAEDPTNKGLLQATMKTWIGAGSDRFENLDAFSKPIQIPDAVTEDYEVGLRAWEDYLRQTGGEAGRDVAEMASLTYFQLVEIGSKDPREATANVAGAVRAQKIVSAHDPGMFTLSDLAIYQYFNGELSTGDRTARAAAVDVRGDGGIEPRDVKGQLNEYKERGEKFVARVRKGFETLEETGEEELETPIKGYGAPAGINGYEPGTGPS